MKFFLLAHILFILEKPTVNIRMLIHVTHAELKHTFLNIVYILVTCSIGRKSQTWHNICGILTQ